MNKYRVILPIEVNGVPRAFGDVIELDEATAIEFSFALIAWEGEENGRQSEGPQRS